MAAEASKEYQSSLEELTFNSKLHINVLTMLAEENVNFAENIVQVIEKHIHQAPPDRKLPTLYLMDSILKNLRNSPYSQLFAQNIVTTFVAVFEKVDEKKRQSMYKLRQTWTEIFSNSKLYAVDVRVHSIDPAWPITAHPPETAVSSIHVNPKFLNQQQEDEKRKLQQEQEEMKRLQTMEEENLRRELEEEERKRQAETEGKKRREEEERKKWEEEQERKMREELLAKQQELMRLHQQRLELELEETRRALVHKEKLLKEKETEDSVKKAKEEELKQIEKRKEEEKRLRAEKELRKNLEAEIKRKTEEEAKRKAEAEVRRKSGDTHKKSDTNRPNRDPRIKHQAKSVGTSGKSTSVGSAKENKRSITPNKQSTSKKKDEDNAQIKDKGTENNKKDEIRKDNQKGTTKKIKVISVKETVNTNQEKHSATKEKKDEVLIFNKDSVLTKSMDVDIYVPQQDYINPQDNSGTAKPEILNFESDSNKDLSSEVSLIKSESKKKDEPMQTRSRTKDSGRVDEHTGGDSRESVSSKTKLRDNRSHSHERDTRSRREQRTRDSDRSSTRTKTRSRGGHDRESRKRSEYSTNSPAREETGRNPKFKDWDRDRNGSRRSRNYRPHRRSNTPSSEEEEEMLTLRPKRFSPTHSKPQRRSRGSNTPERLIPRKFKRENSIEKDQHTSEAKFQDGQEKPASSVQKRSFEDKVSDEDVSRGMPPTKKAKEENQPSLSSDIADLFGTEDVDYRQMKIPLLPKKYLDEPVDFNSPQQKGWAKFKENRPDEFPFLQPRRLSVDTSFKSPLISQLSNQGMTSPSFQQKTEPNPIINSSDVENILQQADTQLIRGRMSYHQYHELQKQLKELQRLQTLMADMKNVHKLKDRRNSETSYHDYQHERMHNVPPMPPPPIPKMFERDGETLTTNLHSGPSVPAFPDLSESQCTNVSISTLKSSSKPALLESPPKIALEETGHTSVSVEHETDSSKIGLLEIPAKPTLIEHLDETCLKDRKPLLETPERPVLLASPRKSLLGPGPGELHSKNNFENTSSQYSKETEEALIPKLLPQPRISPNISKTRSVSPPKETEIQNKIFVSNNNKIVNSKSHGGETSMNRKMKADPARNIDNTKQIKIPSLFDIELVKPMKSLSRSKQALSNESLETGFYEGKQVSVKMLQDRKALQKDFYEGKPLPSNQTHWNIIERDFYEEKALPRINMDDRKPMPRINMDDRKPMSRIDMDDRKPMPRINMDDRKPMPRIDMDDRKPMPRIDMGDNKPMPRKIDDTSDRKLFLRRKVDVQSGHDSFDFETPQYDTDKYYVPEYDPRWVSRQKYYREPKVLNVYELVINGTRSYQMRIGAPPRVIYFSEEHKMRVKIDENTKEVLINTTCYTRVGEPERTVVINGKKYRIFVQGQVKRFWIDGHQFELRIDAPADFVNIAGKRHEMRLDGQLRQVFLDGIGLCPIDLNKVLTIEIDSENHFLQFYPPPRKILIDQQLCDLNLAIKFPTVMVNGKEHGIRFNGPPRKMLINDREYEIPMDKPYIFRIDGVGKPYAVSFGGPGHEVIIDEYWYEVKFNAPSTFVKIGFKSLKLQLPGPPPDVKILGIVTTQEKIDQIICGEVEQSYGSSNSGISQIPGDKIASKQIEPEMTKPNVPVNQPQYRGGQDINRPMWNPRMTMDGANLNRPLVGGMQGPNSLPRNMNPNEFHGQRLPQQVQPPPLPLVLPHLDVGDLFSKLVSAGIINRRKSGERSNSPMPQPQQGSPVTAPEVSKLAPETVQLSENTKQVKSKPETPIKEKEEEVPDLTDLCGTKLKKKYKGIVNTLYTGIQCNSCGTRFKDDKTDKYKEHLDWHFRQNKREKEDSRVVRNRRWYYSITNWVQFEEIGDLEDRFVSSYFENMLASIHQAIGSNEGSTLETTAETCPIASANDEDNVCVICGDPFEQFYDDEEEEWHLREAIRVENKTYHPVCYEDAKDDIATSSLLETPSPQPQQVQSLPDPIQNPLAYLSALSQQAKETNQSLDAVAKQVKHDPIDTIEKNSSSQESDITNVPSDKALSSMFNIINAPPVVKIKTEPPEGKNSIESVKSVKVEPVKNKDKLAVGSVRSDPRLASKVTIKNDPRTAIKLNVNTSSKNDEEITLVSLSKDADKSTISDKKPEVICDTDKAHGINCDTDKATSVSVKDVDLTGNSVTSEDTESSLGISDKLEEKCKVTVKEKEAGSITEESMDTADKTDS